MAGYAIKIGSQWLDLIPSQKITLNKASQLLADAVIPGVVSFPFVVPSTNHNRFLLGNIQNLSVFDYNDKINCQIYLEGNHYRSGYLVLNGWDLTSFDCTFTEFDNTQDWKAMKVSDCDFPKYSWTFDHDNPNEPLPAFYQQIKDRNSGIFPGGIKDFVAPTIYNPLANGVNQFFWDFTAKSQNTEFQNLFFDGEFCPLLHDNLFFPGNYTYPCNTISLFPYLNYVIEKVFDKLGFNIEYNILTEGEYADIIIHSNRGNSLFNNDQNQHTDPFQTGTPCRPRFYEDEFDLKKYVPSMSIPDFLSSIKKMFNLEININQETKTVEIRAKNQLLPNLSIIDITDKCSPYDRVRKEQYKIPGALKYANFIGASTLDMSKYRYLGELLSPLNLPAIGNDGDTYYVLSTDRLHNWDPVSATWNPFGIITNGYNGNNDLYISTNEAVEFNADTASNAKDINYNETAVDMGVTPVPWPFTKRFSVPRVDRGITTDKGIIDNLPHDNGTNDQLYLMFYRGMVNPVESGFSYPYASIDAKHPYYVHPPVGFPLPADAYQKSLEMYGPKGIYQNFYKDWISFFKNTRQVDFFARLSLAEIETIERYKLRIGENLFILKSLQITASPTKIEKCKMETYQIQPQ